MEYEGNNRRTGRYVAPNEPMTRDYSEPFIINYRDSIHVIDCGRIWRKLQIRRFEGHELRIVKDGCGIFAVIFTWLLIIFAEFIVWGVLLIPAYDRLHSVINGVVFQFLTCLAGVSHLRAMFTDPGAIPRGNATRENIEQLGLGEGDIVYRCPKCICIKPDRAHHCRVCRRCIRKMDHHCPWINNCVGELNQKYFLLFLIYTCVISIHAFYLTVRHFVICVNYGWQDCSSASPVVSTIFMILLLIEAVLFAVFTGFMFITQIWAIWTDETAIEHLKKDRAVWDRKSSWMSVKDVFGPTFSYKWFSPFHAALPSLSEMVVRNVEVPKESCNN